MSRPYALDQMAPELSEVASRLPPPACDFLTRVLGASPSLADERVDG